MRRPVLILLILCFALLLARLRSYHEPPEWDIGTYLSVAREMLEGERLYADAWDVKPPAIFVTFAIVQFSSGDGALSVYLLSVTAAIVTMLGIYYAASASAASTPVQSEGRNDRSAGPARAANGATAGICGALFWSVMCLEPRTGANLPNTEVFINACLAWALALWLAAPVNELSRRRCVAIAMLFALASLYKQVAAATAAFVAVAHVMAAPPAHRRRAVRQVLGMAAVGLLVWAAVMGYFIATGRGWLAWQTLFVAPRAYAGGRMLENIAWSIIPQKGTAQYLFFALPALLLTVVAALLGTRAAPRRVWLMFAGLVVGTHVALVLPGAFHWHYYQLWFVPLSIGAGWGAAGLLNLLGPRRRPLAYVVVALALLAMIAPQASWYKLDGREWARRKYGDFFIYAHDAFRAASNEHLAPGETFYTWSDEAYAYPVTSRRPPATALWKMHTTTGPLADWLTQRTLADLQKNPPAMIILYGDQPDPPGHPILEWTRQHYDLVPDPRRRFFPLTIYVRR